MTAFDKAREIAKTTIISNSFDRAAVEIAKALLAYEPTPDAREAAREIINKHAVHGGYTRWGLVELENDMASAIARATAASEARVRELETALRILAIVQHVRMVQGGGLVTNGKSCKVCKTEWDDDAPEKHADNCVLHHTDTVGGAR